ncbi:MAG: aminotransferase class I/II-fold pyridoxal phosphate-dependent enzyme [Treponema sp.]|nr:aminotransferase class I/II-fold pyridoxal phosphate-dependent enzyme [Treponema sp.]
MENSSRFFRNTDCSYFPCHKGIDCEEFNCLFCYCPLYSRPSCPGNPTFIKKEDGRIVKRCTDCTFPHRAENYDKIIALLKNQNNQSSHEEYHHGGEVDSSISQAEDFIDFSVNTNPLGLPQGVKSVIKESLDDLSSYPDQKCQTLKKAMIKKYPCLSEENLIFGNGASQLISLAVDALSPKNVVIVGPTFSGYSRALRVRNCRIFNHFLKRENDFEADESLLDCLKRGEVKMDMIFLCNPNNPTGKMIRPELLKELLFRCEKEGVFLFLDQCFLDFSQRSDESLLPLVKDNPHLILLDAFTKTYAMAGIRLGWLASSNLSLLKKMAGLQPEWSLSLLAQKAGEKALTEDSYLEESRKLIGEERSYLEKELKALGYSVTESQTNFIFFSRVSEKLYEFMLKNHILVRNCGNFPGLDKTDYRMAVKSHRENERFISLLKEFSLSGEGHASK